MPRPTAAPPPRRRPTTRRPARRASTCPSSRRSADAMRDVNGSSFFLLADPADWPFTDGMAWDGSAMTLLGQQNWRLPTADRATARAALGASVPVVIDTYDGVARL